MHYHYHYPYALPLSLRLLSLQVALVRCRRILFNLSQIPLTSELFS